MTIQPHEMTPAEIEEFLQAPRHAILGTNRPNGPPQITPVWYLYENNQVYVYMGVKSAKYKNLRRNPQMSICIAGESPDARAVMLSGAVELLFEDTTPWVSEIVWRIVRRYSDSDDAAQEYIDSWDVEDKSVLVVLSSENMLTHDFN
ncbi:MAG: hypothetical protein GY763_12785 [Gammaproteobacteria bacterium]|nr:hypothetical protein [Gammaproteobacteria bacterium]